MIVLVHSVLSVCHGILWSRHSILVEEVVFWKDKGGQAMEGRLKKKVPTFVAHLMQRFVSGLSASARVISAGGGWRMLDAAVRL